MQDTPYSCFVKIIFHPLMQRSYDSTPAGAPGRIDSAIDVLRSQPDMEFVEPKPATEKQILLAHTPGLIEDVKQDADSRDGLLYQMAALAAGGAILTAETAVRGEPAFGLVRPPGHHSSRNSYWGYCYFSNMAIALLSLRSMGLIKSAFILDFDLHVGDGTINVLGDDGAFTIHNPSAKGDKAYLQNVKRALDASPEVDIIAASAGFDEYVHCWGKNLSTDAFKRIGLMMYEFANERCEGRRFGILEGGYNHKDLGINVLAFCRGLLGEG